MGRYVAGWRGGSGWSGGEHESIGGSKSSIVDLKKNKDRGWTIKEK